MAPENNGNAFSGNVEQHVHSTVPIRTRKKESIYFDTSLPQEALHESKNERKGSIRLSKKFRSEYTEYRNPLKPNESEETKIHHCNQKRHIGLVRAKSFNIGSLASSLTVTESNTLENNSTFQNIPTGHSLRRTKSASCLKVTFSLHNDTDFGQAINRHKSSKMVRLKLRSKKLHSKTCSTNPAASPVKAISDKAKKYRLTYCMILGIRNSIVKQSPEHDHEISPLDFNKTVKEIFPPKGSDSTPAHELAQNFIFKDYAPLVFRSLRTMFKINEEDYVRSLCKTNSFIDFTTNSKSGQFFFFSNDGKYMIKSLPVSETRFLRRILPFYYKYLKDNPNSLLVRFCGLHRVKAPQSREKHFIVMCSVYSSASRRKITNVYDLKGSTKGRAAKAGEHTLKDMDALSNNQKFCLGSLRDGFLNQLKEDTQFLEAHGVMDYSLLIGIHNKLQMQDDFALTLDIKSGKFKSIKNQNEINFQLDKSCEHKTSKGIEDEETKKENHASVSNIGDDNGMFIESQKSEEAFVSRYSVVKSETEDGTAGVEAYYMGIIDILQEYNLRKKAETFLMSRVNRRDSISSVPPNRYASRFKNFIAKLIV